MIYVISRQGKTLSCSFVVEHVYWKHAMMIEYIKGKRHVPGPVDMEIRHIQGVPKVTPPL